MHRRLLLSATCLALPVHAQRRRPAREQALRLGADPVLVDSGWARRLVSAFGRESGLPVQVVAAPTSALLSALEHGEMDAGLGLAPQAEFKLAQQGLVHDRHLLAATDFVLVGPATRGVIPSGVAGNSDVAQALARLAAAGTPCLGRDNGSGAHWMEQTLWRAAGTAPVAPWYRVLVPGIHPLDAARQQAACVLVDRPAWLSGPRQGLTLLVSGDPRLTAPIHVMRSFRVDHPAGKLFVRWLAGPRGRRVGLGQAGFRAIT